METGNLVLLLLALGYVPVALLIAVWHWRVKWFAAAYQTEHGQEQAKMQHRRYRIGSALLVWLYTLIFLVALNSTLMVVYLIASAIWFVLDRIRRKQEMSWYELNTEAFRHVGAVFGKLKNFALVQNLKPKPRERVATTDEGMRDSFSDDVDALKNDEHGMDAPPSLVGQRRKTKPQATRNHGGWKSV